MSVARLNTTFPVPQTAILLVTGEFPPAIGGVGDYTATLAARLHAQGAAVGVLTGPAPAGATNPPPANLLVMRGAGEWRLGDWQTLTTAIAGQQPSIVHIQYQAGAFGGRAAVHLLPRWLRQRPHPPV
ncbi:MAG: glycosyltransferase, partial [Thermomicrobiales bacterium]